MVEFNQKLSISLFADPPANIAFVSFAYIGNRLLECSKRERERSAVSGKERKIFSTAERAAIDMRDGRKSIKFSLTFLF